MRAAGIGELVRRGGRCAAPDRRVRGRVAFARVLRERRARRARRQRRWRSPRRSAEVGARPRGRRCTGPGGPRWCAGPRTSPHLRPRFAVFWHGGAPSAAPWRCPADEMVLALDGTTTTAAIGEDRRRRRATPVVRCATAARRCCGTRTSRPVPPAELDEARRLHGRPAAARALRRSPPRPVRRHGRGRARPAAHDRAAFAAGRGRAGRSSPGGRRARGPAGSCCCCDVSGSMEPYARALLRFAHGAVIGGGRGSRRSRSAPA